MDGTFLNEEVTSTGADTADTTDAVMSGGGLTDVAAAAVVEGHVAKAKSTKKRCRVMFTAESVMKKVVAVRAKIVKTKQLIEKNQEVIAKLEQSLVALQQLPTIQPAAGAGVEAEAEAEAVAEPVPPKEEASGEEDEDNE